MTISRRHLLRYAASASALAATGAIPATLTRAFAAEEEKRTIPWKNWSGGQSATPEIRLAPASEAELSEIVKTSVTPIRAVGAGHSFSPLVPTQGTLLSLDRLNGLIGHDPERQRATLRAGTRLGAMGDLLAAKNLALANMPDINKQTIAGAISTATHGTGADIGSLSSFVTAMRLTTASGDALDCDETSNPDLLSAARVSLGALGIVTQTTLQARALYKLKRRTWTAPVEEMLEQAPELWASHRNFEFYYVPYSGMTIAITNDETDEPETPEPVNEDDDGLRQLQQLQDWLGWSRKFSAPRSPRPASTIRTRRFRRNAMCASTKWNIICRAKRPLRPCAKSSMRSRQTMSRSSSRSNSARPHPTMPGSAPSTSAKAAPSPSTAFTRKTTNPISA